jgi:hypothetical protein
MSGISGDAPGDDVHSLISAISDRQVQAALHKMNENNAASFNRVFGMISSVVTEMQSHSKDMQWMKTTWQAQFAPLPPASFPVFQEGRTPSARSSTPSGSLHSVMTDGSDAVATAGSAGVIGLRCLFCNHQHVLEKSHYQHYDRLLKRVVSGAAYSGSCVIPSDHWLFRHFGGPNVSQTDAIRLFINKYLSFLQHGNESFIDPGRAAKVADWLMSLSQQH